MNKIKIYLIVIISFLSQSCEKKIFSEGMDDYVFQLKDGIYLDQPSQAILIMEKINEDNYTVKGVIVDKIDSVYINKNKTEIYIINKKNEYIWVKPDFKTEKLNKRPDVDFKSIMSYHD